MYKMAILVTPVLLFAHAAEAKTTAWKLDHAHTTVGFSAKHLGITEVQGHFKTFEATISADPTTGKITALTATARADSVDTGITQRDDHLWSDDFFAAKDYPVLSLKVTSLKWSGQKLTGKMALTIRGITKTVPFTGRLVGIQKVDFGHGAELRAGYQATAEINRKDFGLKFNKLMEGVAVVSESVRINVQVQMSRPIQP